jgi:pimeloyl-ACP methyl ester carboxylesterase
MKRLTAISIAWALLAAAGCSSSNGPDIGDTDPTSGNGIGGRDPQPAATAALFQPLQGVLPFPTDLYFAGSTDGTLNIQPANALSPNQVGLNALDGFSTTAVIRARFGGAIDPASLTATSVRVIQVAIDNSTKATTGVIRPLVIGTDPATADVSVGIAADAGVGNSILEITPLKPLVPSTGPTNNGYLVLLTNEIQAGGGAATADADYASIKAALPNCAGITDASMNGICQLTGANLQIAQALGVDPATVVLSFSFSTQSTHDTMDVLGLTTTAEPITVQNSGLTTQALQPTLPGIANVYVGTFTIPYYLTRPSAANATAPIDTPWHGGASPLDANSTFLTRFNPVPEATETIQIPIFVTVPNAGAPGGGVKPVNGWPVLIFQHGLTRNRLDALGVADTYASEGYVVVSIDLPLHGVTDPANPLYQANNERTFNLDLLDNTSLASGPDGQIDGSGIHFVNLPHPILSRDNLRQGAVDLLALTRSLADLDLDGDSTGDIDTTRIHFLGHSLGGIVGGVYLGTAAAAEVQTGVLAMAGGGVAATILDSPAFGPVLQQGLAAQGITQGSTLYAQFVRDVQTIVDAGDPVNYIATAEVARPLLLFQVVGGGDLGGGQTSLPDQVVVNASTQRLIDAAALPRISTPGPNSVSQGYVSFIFGDHASIIDPTASLATTAEMQTEALTFAETSGTVIAIADPAVVQP